MSYFSVSPFDALEERPLIFHLIGHFAKVFGTTIISTRGMRDAEEISLQNLELIINLTY